jgi:hypothetical protein
MRFVRQSLATAVLAGAILALASVPSSAGTLNACGRPGHVVVSLPGDGSFVCVWAHSWMTICDRQRDGHRTVALWDSQWSPGIFTFSPFVKDGTCFSLGNGGDGAKLWSIRVCVQHERCSARRQSP